jgi:hypothetical protein
LQAEKTMRNTATARGVPKDRGRFVTRMKIGPRDLRECSFAASDAEVEEAGYSPYEHLSVTGISSLDEIN